MSTTDDIVRGRIENRLSEICEAMGWDESYVEEYTMQAAMKAAPVFQTLGYSYGDRIPDIYKLNDTILECVISAVKYHNKHPDEDTCFSSTGMFKASLAWDEYGGQWEIDISLELATAYENRVKKD